MKQQYRTTAVARIEVRFPWPDLPNLLTNPYPVGVVGSLSSWALVQITTNWTMTATAQGIRLTTVAGRSSVEAQHRIVPITYAPGMYVRAQARRTAGASTTESTLLVAFYAGTSLLGVSGSATRTTNGLMEYPATAIPAGTTNVKFYVNMFRTGGLVDATFGDAVMVIGTAAEVAAASMTVDTPWTDITGPTFEITVERDELQVGVLTAQIADSTLDPARVDLIRPGRSIRLLAIVGGVTEQLFGGKILTGTATYDLRAAGPTAKQTRITLTAVDPLSGLANTPAPEGVATIDELPYVLAAGGVPWNVNGSSIGIQLIDVTVVSRVDQASVVDQLAITRDTAMGYAWLDRNGVIQAWDADQIPTALAATLDEGDYSDLDVSFDTDRCINTVTVKQLRIDPGTGDTEEVSFGPYTDPASVRTWGARAAEFTVQGIDDADVPAYAAAILAANATPTVRINAVTLPLRTVAEFNANVTRDLYDLVEVSNTRAAISDAFRVVSVRHRITGKRWFTDLGFAADQSVAPPQVTPSPSDNAGPTLAQRLRPVGEVTMFYGASSAVPAGWLICNGAAFSAATYPRLAALLGGTTLPNLVDRFPIGAGVKALGTSGGAPTKNLTAANVDAEQAVGGYGLTVTGGFANRVLVVNTSDPVTPTDVMPPWRAVYFIIRAV